MAGRLYVVGTPIGNLEDITERAISTLRSVDLVAAEDTRRTGRLLAHLGIKKKMRSLFEGNGGGERRSCSSCSARGPTSRSCPMPDAGVSDPGYRLVHACADGGSTSGRPGPSAVTAALVVSGLPVERFVFEAFLPRKAGERRARLRAMAHDPRTVVLFESPLRLSTLLRDILVELGDRQIAVCRELTKLHEETVRGRVTEVIAVLADFEPRGEVVVVMEGARPEQADLDALVDEARTRVAAGVRKREAAAAVAKERGGSANAIYDALIHPG
jgi:16S rRNA (cytidine1402-2'-O)-methyltransferase